MELTIHQAVANSKMPNKRFTPFIQAPALGSKKPDVAPTASNNKPSPQAIANRAVPPNIKSPVCEMNSKKSGKEHVGTPVTNAQHVYRLMHGKNKVKTEEYT